MTHVGIGYDVHQFKEGRRLFLGGVEYDSPIGLDGHSDADVLLHAVADALLGALGKEDIGHFFPNTDPQWKDVRSVVFLEAIRGQVETMGARIVNIDATVIAETPKIYPRIGEMKTEIGRALAIDPTKIGIKATTNETMGFIGRKEGVAAMAVASVERG